MGLDFSGGFLHTRTTKQADEVVLELSLVEKFLVTKVWLEGGSPTPRSLIVLVLGILCLHGLKSHITYNKIWGNQTPPNSNFVSY